MGRLEKATILGIKVRTERSRLHILYLRDQTTYTLSAIRI